MNSGTAIRMKGSTPPMKDRKIVSSGCVSPATTMTPTVVPSSAYSSGTPDEREGEEDEEQRAGEHVKRTQRCARECAARDAHEVPRDPHGHRGGADRACRGTGTPSGCGAR